jgi:pilus assembly protein CpaB
VDVLVTGTPPDPRGRVTNTVLQNILVLSAGQTMQPDARGGAINAPTVTVLVTPEQAEMLTLAANDGKIHLVLRNASDQTIEKTPSREVAELYGAPKKAKPQGEPVRRVRAQPPPPPEMAMTPRLPPPPPDEVVVIRGTAKTVEVVGVNRSESR